MIGLGVLRRVRRIVPRPPRGLDALVQPLSSELGTSLAGVADPLVVVLARPRSVVFARALADTLPDVEVVVLTRVHAETGSAATWTTHDDLLAAMAGLRRPAVVIDALRGHDAFGLFKQVFWSIRAGGSYVVLDPTAAFRSRVTSSAQRVTGDATGAGRRRRELADAQADITRGRRTIAVTKRNDHVLMLRHRAVETTLGARFGPDWGEVITRHEPFSFRSRAEVVMHGEPAPRDKPQVIDVPSLALRRYADVTCHVREIMVRDNLVLPDSFRHWNSTRLFHKRIRPASSWFGRLDSTVESATVRREPGEFFAFDSAFPTHFGHLATETLSRFWGWRIARERNPGIRPVMTHQRGKDRLPAFKREMLQALDVPLDDILWVTQDESVRVESLVAAMPQLENPFYVDPGISETWEQLGAASGGAETRHPEKIFLSRRPGSQRYCTNTPEVENLMREQGFAVIHAEDLPFAEQVRLFKGAKVIAGFAGSALFNAMFNPSAKVVLIASQSYVAANEYLIASVGGNELHYFWSPPEVRQPDSAFSVDAYRSSFTFPLDEHRTALLAALG